ncbi:MAG: fimbrillin family protein [Bacteroidales bacterium]|nr:fimbrillin family protein [Bacteroidales bacterium]
MKKYIISLIALVVALNACNRGDIVPDSAKNEKVFSVVVDAPVAVKSVSDVTCREMQVSAECNGEVAVSLMESSRPAPVGVSTKVYEYDIITDNYSFRNIYGEEGFAVYAVGATEPYPFRNLGTMHYSYRYNNGQGAWLLSDPTNNPESYDDNMIYAGLAPNDPSVISVSEELFSYKIYCTPKIDKQKNIMIGLSYAYHHDEPYYCLHFMHATSLVTFRFLTDDFYSSATLKSIGLYGVCSRGEFTTSVTDPVGSSEYGKHCLQCVDASVPEDYVLTDTEDLSNQGVFVVPTIVTHTHGAGAYIKAEIEVPGADGPIAINAQASLEDVSWKPGYIYYYTVKLRDLVTPGGSTEDYTGGSSYGNDLFN